MAVTDNGKSEGLVVLGAVGTLVAIMVGVSTIASNGFKAANDYQTSPLNPANYHRLSWHEVRSNESKPVDGMYCSTIEVHVHNTGNVMVEHVGVLIKTLTKNPCVTCEGGEDTEAPDGQRLVKFSKLTAKNTVKVIVIEWLPKFPATKSLFSEDGEYGFAGHVAKVTYEKGPIECNNELCKANFKKLELVSVPLTPIPSTSIRVNSPAPVPRTQVDWQLPAVTQPLPADVVHKATNSKFNCGCGKPNCRCGAICKCNPVQSTPRRSKPRR